MITNQPIPVHDQARTWLALLKADGQFSMARAHFSNVSRNYNRSAREVRRRLESKGLTNTQINCAIHQIANESEQQADTLYQEFVSTYTYRGVTYRRVAKK